MDAFSSERTYRAFTTQAVSGRLISRRKSEREYEAKKEEEGKSESEEDLLDDWVNVLKEEERGGGGGGSFGSGGGARVDERVREDYATRGRRR